VGILTLPSRKPLWDAWAFFVLLVRASCHSQNDSADEDDPRALPFVLAKRHNRVHKWFYGRARLQVNGFVEGHAFRRAAKAPQTLGFSPCGLVSRSGKSSMRPVVLRQKRSGRARVHDQAALLASQPGEARTGERTGRPMHCKKWSGRNRIGMDRTRPGTKSFWPATENIPDPRLAPNPTARNLGHPALS
jgi:hypothetical protein